MTDHAKTLINIADHNRNLINDQPLREKLHKAAAYIRELEANQRPKTTKKQPAKKS